MASTDGPKLPKPESGFSFKEALKVAPKSDDGTILSSGITDGLTNITGLDTGAGAANVGSIDDRYKEVAKKKNWSVFSDKAGMERKAYLEQTKQDAWWNMGAGFVKQAAGGFLKSVAAWDIKGLTDLAIGGSEKKYGNWLDTVADGILKSGQEDNPIFQSGDNSMWNKAYWANQIQSLGLTAGIIGEAVAEQGLLGLTTGGSGNAVALGNKAKLLRSLGKQFTFGSIKGVQEGYINALETQSKVYQKYIDLGYDDKVASDKSAEAATLGFRAEVLPLMILNGLQFGLTFGAGTRLTSAFGAGQRQGLNSGFSGAAETLIDRILPNVKNKYVKGGIETILNAGSESFEEGIQTGVGKYAEHETLKSTGDAKGELELFNDSEMRDSMVGGALGGVLFSGVGKAIAPLIKSTNAKRIDHVYNNFLNAAPTRAAEIFANKSAAEAAYVAAQQEATTKPSKENDAKLAKAAATYKAAQTDAHLSSTLNALHLDYITGKTTAFESHIEQMQNISDAVKANDLVKLKEYNLVDTDGKEKFEGSFDYITANFEDNIRQSNQAKEMLDKNLTHLTSDYESAWDITKQELKNQLHTEDIAKTQATLDGLYANDAQFKQLSPEGQLRFKLNTELEGLIALGGTVNEQRVKDITAQLVTDEDGGYSTEDAKIVGTISKFIYEKGYSAIGATRELIDKGNNSLVDLKDQQKIRQKIENRTKTQINQATTKEQLAQVAQEAAQAGVVNTAIQQSLIDQTANIVAQQEAQILAEQTQNAPAQTAPIVNPANTKAQSMVVGNASLFGDGIISDATVFEPISEAPVLEGSDVKSEEVKAKEADIEKRRQQELDDLDANNYLNNRGFRMPQAKYDEIKGKVNAKYDAELAALKLESESLKSENKPIQNDPEAVRASRVTAMLSPSAVDPAKLEQKKAGLKTAVGKMIDQLKPDATFEDLVRNFAMAKGSSIELAEKNFNGLKEGWKLNNKPDENFDEVYNNIFSDPIADFLGLDIYSDEQKKAEEEEQAQEQADTADRNAQTENRILEQEAGKAVITPQGTVTYNYDGKITASEFPTLAVMFRLSETHKTLNEDGTVDVTHTYTEEGLLEGTDVDSRPLLAPDAFTEGTTLQVSIPQNFNGIIVAVYNGDGTKTGSLPFGVWAAREAKAKGITVDEFSKSQEYKDKIPMIVHRNGAPVGEKGVAFVHDIGWYSPINFAYDQQANMQSAIDKTKATREAVLADPLKPVSITITRKRATSFNAFKTPVIGTTTDGKPMYQFIPFTEANPEAILVLGDAGNVLKNQNKIFEDGDNVINRKQDALITDGFLYELRRAGTENGKKTWNLLEVTPQPISTEIKYTVLGATNIYLNRNNPNVSIRSKHDAIAKEILDVTGYDLKNTIDFRNYLRQFINVKGDTDVFEKDDNADSVSATANSFLAKNGENVGYFHVQKGGTIYIGGTRTNAFGNTQTIYSNSNKFDDAGVKRVLEYLAKKYLNGNKSILDTFRHNYSMKAAQENKAVVMIGEKGEVIKKANSYREYALSAFNTNVKSVNVAPEGQKPIYASNGVAIEFDLTSNVGKPIEVATTEQIVAEAVSPVQQAPLIDETVEPQRLSEIERLEEEAAKWLQDDLGISEDKTNWDDIASVSARSIEERMAYNNLETRVANLEPLEDAQLNSFIFNQIAPILDAKGTISKKEIKAEVARIMEEVFAPIRADRQTKIDLIKANIEKYPELKDRDYGQKVLVEFEREVARMAEVQSPRNMKVLYDNAEATVLSNLGIKESKIDQMKEDADGNFSEANEDEREGWQIDSLSQDPNAKTSARLKRFYSSIPILNKDGKPKKGVFGLPTYYSLDEVGTMTKALLADEKADFKTMLDKMKATEKYAWMPQLIEKLEKSDHQTGMQFVSDNAMSSLRLKFVMVLFDRKTNSYKTQMWDANQGGVIDQILSNWESDFANSDLVLGDTDDEGNLILNKIRAQLVLDMYDDMAGTNVPELQAPMGDFAKKASNIYGNKTMTFSPVVGSALHTELTNATGRVKYKYSNSRAYSIVNKGDNNFELSVFKDVVPTQENIEKFLGEFGIKLHPKAIAEFMKDGLMHNYKQGNFNTQLTGAGGLLKVLADTLRYGISQPGDYSYTESGKSPLREGVVKSLAALEYKYNTTVVPTGGFANGKNFYAITQAKFATERTLALTQKDSILLKQLKDTSFSKHSLWLDMLGDDKFSQNFAMSHVAFNALQVLGKSLKEDSSLHQLSDLDYEIASLGGFWDTRQETVGIKYKGTNIGMRMATMLMPTMSDKDTGLWIKTAVLDLQNKDLGAGKSISDEVKKILFEQTVLPELERIISFYNKGGKTNIKNYDKGAGLFMLIPKLNTIMYNNDMTLKEALSSPALKGKITPEVIQNAPILMGKIYDAIEETVMSLQKEQKKAWADMGITESKEGKVIKTNFVDAKYINKFNGNIEEKVDMALLDSVVNQMVHLANSFMVFGGDPAMYFKSDAKRADFATEQEYITQLAKDSFVNAGKRLANQIAPGIKLAESETEQYLQVFLEDRASIGDKNFMQYTTRILDGKAMTDEEHKFVEEYVAKPKSQVTDKDLKEFERIKFTYPKSAGFFTIEASDAQEYTTWQEHLNILEKMGRHPDIMSDITAEDIANARKLFGSNKKDLTLKDKALISLVMQPIKPVYTGQMYDNTQDVMRTMYIKTSSFPLIPQLTQGFEIDKVRLALESLQKKRGMSVRASYQSGNKVGALSNPLSVWDSEGRAKDLSNIEASSLTLDRKNFRIQQDVPFKSGKKNKDEVSMGTQLMKLLFGGGIMGFDGFKYVGVGTDGKVKGEWTGTELQAEFSRLHIELVELKKTQLHAELGLDINGRPIDYAKSMKKIQKVLLSEGKDRGFPKQVLDGLVLQGEGEDTEFTLPLWASINSNKFENLLNAIITNRIAKIKMPGNSYIAGSPEGFRTTTEMGDQSQMVFTDSWDGESLKASYYADGKVKKVQVFVASKFRLADGTMINLLDDEWSEDVTDANGKTTRRIKQDKFDKELFNLTSFRIPTTGLSSGSQIEIVGFLPHTSGDLMILPGNITKQKGLDFDVDKENTYQYHHILSNGKFERLSDKHRTQYIDYTTSADTEGLMADAADNLAPEYTDEDLKDSKIKKASNSFAEKALQNKIVEIYESVYSNTNDKLQAKINSVLSTDYTEAEAARIESMTPKDDTNWTPLSQQYQKSKVALGAAGKIGTGAYALDITFHSLAQQANAMGKAMEINFIKDSQITDGTYLDKVNWRFGKESEGGVESDGILGRIETLDGDRTTSDVLNEIGQIAVDNEKLQIMGKVNLNSLTLDVHKVFNLLGFDKFKTKNKHNIAFLFMSQPILKEYVAQLANSTSTLNTSFDPDKKTKIQNALLEKYWPELTNTERSQILEDQFSDLMSETNMSSAIQSNNPATTHGKMQAGVLLRFLEMEKFGLAIRNIQTTLNVDSKGLGKSFFDIVQKMEKIDAIGNGTNIKDETGKVSIGNITNVDGLIGDYKETEGLPAEEISKLQEAGYYNMGQFLVKPTTYIGSFNVVTTHTGYNAWKDFMPFDSEILQTINQEILDVIQTDSKANNSKTIENKQDILAEFKKYLATFYNAGFLGDFDNANEERARLFLDSETNTSLATYIQKLREVQGNPVVDAFIKSNKLFNSLEIRPSKVGQPSLIRFNNTKGESFDEAHLYEAMSSLLEVRGKNGQLTLPTIGNKSYTLDTLVQDMIAYSMLANAKQEAIQFTKYIPVQYLNQVGFSMFMRATHRKLNGKASEEARLQFMQKGLGLVLEKGDDSKHFVSEFTTQYIQHNPEYVKATVDAKEEKKLLPKVAGKENEYVYLNDKQPTFIKVYDPYLKSKKKFKLYKYNGINYNQIPILGVFGMDEYQYGTYIGKSIVNGVATNVKQPTKAIQPTQGNLPNNVSEIKDGMSVKDALLMLSRADSKYKEIAAMLAPYVVATDGFVPTIIITDTIMQEGKPYHNFDGAYDPRSGDIKIHPKILNDPERLGQALLHEAIHVLTYDKVKDWVVTGLDGFAKVKENAPQYARDLVLLFNHSRSTVTSAEMLAFKDKLRTSTVSVEERSNYYGLTSVDEFMTMALTDKGFQEKLNSIKYMSTDKSLLDKFKEFVLKVLDSFGVKFDENYTAAHAISTIFDVIKSGSEIKEDNSFNQFYTEDSPIEDRMNFDENPWSDSNPEPPENLGDNPSQVLDMLSVSAINYPDTKFDIGNTEC